MHSTEKLKPCTTPPALAALARIPVFGSCGYLTLADQLRLPAFRLTPLPCWAPCPLLAVTGGPALAQERPFLSGGQMDHGIAPTYWQTAISSRILSAVPSTLEVGSCADLKQLLDYTMEPQIHHATTGTAIVRASIAGLACGYGPLRCSRQALQLPPVGCTRHVRPPPAGAHDPAGVHLLHEPSSNLF